MILWFGPHLVPYPTPYSFTSDNEQTNFVNVLSGWVDRTLVCVIWVDRTLACVILEVFIVFCSSYFNNLKVKLF